MPTDSFQPGDYIADRYQVRYLAKGGMGIIYFAWDIALEEAVALKTCQVRRSHSQELIDWFLTEAKTWIRLERHNHIVQAKSTFVLQEQPYIVAEFVDGGDLRQLLRKGRVAIAHVLRIALHFCTGADYAYRKLGLIHRDVKPENLLLDNRGTLKISDFGLSQVSGEVQTKRTGITGTPPYMSPEQ